MKKNNKSTRYKRTHPAFPKLGHPNQNQDCNRSAAFASLTKSRLNAAPHLDYPGKSTKQRTTLLCESFFWSARIVLLVREPLEDKRPRERRGNNIIFTSGIGKIMALLLPTLIGLIVSTHRCHAWAFIPQSFKSSSSSGRFVHASFRHVAIEATISSPATTSANPTDSVPYDWRDQWYAVTFSSYLPNPSKSAEVTPVSIYGEPLVLWKSEDDGVVYCADDVCPHRSAALSEGRLRDGKLECYYHGWQFDGSKDGECKSIPQLEKGAEIPKRACLKMRELRVVEGIVWVWMGGEKSEVGPPMHGDGLEDIEPATGRLKNYFINDFQIDLPYDHSYLSENLLDPAHIPISHDATEGGGKRENAQAYEMIVDRDSVGSTGFTGRFRTATARDTDGPFTEVSYEAPGIIRYRNPRGKNGMYFGAALHCMPLTLGRSRLLFRTYVRGLPPMLKFIISLKPKFLR